MLQPSLMPSALRVPTGSWQMGHDSPSISIVEGCFGDEPVVYFLVSSLASTVRPMARAATIDRARVTRRFAGAVERSGRQKTSAETSRGWSAPGRLMLVMDSGSCALKCRGSRPKFNTSQRGTGQLYEM